MLKKFEVRNYKNFKESICINFDDIAGYQFSSDCITDGLISKMLIYGRNATGKTNLGKAIMDIYSVLFHGVRLRGDEIFFNADSQDNMTFFSYTFQFDDMYIIYSYSRFAESKLTNEKMIIDGRIIFECDFVAQKYEFPDLKYINAETANTERYIQTWDVEEDDDNAVETKLPFLRWLIGNVALKNSSILIHLADYVRRMVMVTVGSITMLRPMIYYNRFYEFLEKEDHLSDMENFLNAMGIKCKLALKKLPDGQRELYFVHERLVPFYPNASSGTIALVDLYRRIFVNMRGTSLIYLDEFDAFYHYEMAEKVVLFLKKFYPNCQVIMTTHNTNLMTNRLMRPDCLFVLSREGTLTSLCNATLRELREGHNLEKMYISGEFKDYE